MTFSSNVISLLLSRYTLSGFTDRGYLAIGVDGTRYRAHRLAWLYVHGVYPNQIDHENHVRHDNRIINLRETDSTGNSRNQSKPIHNTSGVVGVSLSNRIGRDETRWEVRICGKFLGYFENFFEAVCKRKSMKPPPLFGLWRTIIK